MRLLIDRCAGHQLARFLREEVRDVSEVAERGANPGDSVILPATIRAPICFGSPKGCLAAEARAVGGHKPENPDVRLRKSVLRPCEGGVGVHSGRFRFRKSCRHFCMGEHQEWGELRLSTATRERAKPL